MHEQILHAVRSCNLKLVRELCGQGADEDTHENDPNGFRSRLLLSAAHHGSLPIAAHLIERGAIPTYCAKDGITPLHMAALGGHPAVAAMLIDRGAKVDAKTVEESDPLVDGLTPYCWAVSLYLFDSVTVERRGRYYEMVRLLLSKGADINATDGAGRTALHLTACEWDNASRLSYLLDLDSLDVSAVRLTSLPGNEADRLKIVSDAALDLAFYLIGQGAKLNVKDAAGNTPLEKANQTKFTEMSALLLRSGADDGAFENSGRGALTFATPKKYSSLFKRWKHAR